MTNKEEIEKIIANKLYDYNLGIDRVEYDVIADELAERLVKLFAIPDVSNSEAEVCKHKEYRWHEELEDNTEECRDCGHIRQTYC
jgi:hypothetical protein